MASVGQNLLKKIRNRYLLIPVELCSLCLKQRFITGLQIYTLLKAVSPGYMEIGRELKLQIKNLLSVSERTVYGNLQKLVERNWIGYNPKTKIYYIRSFDVIATIEGFSSRIAGEFRVADIKLQKTQLHKMKAFAAGVVVGYCAYLIKLKKREWFRTVR